jgi:ABC-type transport system substrate-binding protein
MQGEELMERFKTVFTIAGIIAIVILLAVACAKATSTPTPKPTPTPAPTATPTKAPTQVPTPTSPTAGAPTGTLTVVTVDVGTPLFTNAKSAYPTNRLHWAYGITETLATLDIATKSPIPMIAESWSVASDMSKVTVKIRKGIKFNNWDASWGENEVTAEDVAWNYNDAGADNLQSVHDDAGEYSEMYNRWSAVDRYTTQGPIDKYRFDIELMSLAQGGSGASIFSKTVYDKLGAEKALTTLVATGPFTATTWKSDERIEAEAVLNHWRKTPAFKSLRVLEIPEASSRVGMLETGQADIGIVDLKDIKRLEQKGLKVVDVGAYGIQSVYMSGNYWQEKDRDGNVIFPRPGFKPDKDHPWIGDPRDPAQMEKARKVRWALSYAIDREAINDTVLDKLGFPAHVAFMYTNDPLFDKKWEIPYDVNKAKQLLAEAGYPSCFKIPFFIPPDSGFPAEVGEATATYWTNLGCTVEIEKTSYAVRRPTEVKREIDIPWLFVTNHDKPLNEFGNPAFPFAQPGWCGGFEAQELADWYNKIAVATDRETRLKLIRERTDWLHNWQLGVAIVLKPNLLLMNPKKIASWTPHYEVVGNAAMNSFETAVPVR